MRRSCGKAIGACLVVMAAFETASAQDIQERRFGDYSVRITGGQNISETGELEILKSGQRVFDAKELGYAFEDAPPIGADLLGTGEPILVISGYSGGAHCCFSDLLFALGDRFRFAGELDGADSGGVFRQTSGGWVVDIADGTFRYWRTSYASSPQCTLVLRYRNGRWKLAGDEMRRRPFDAKTLSGLAQQVANDPMAWDETEKPGFGRYNTALWQTMLDLIYSGNPVQAFQFFDTAWPARFASEKEQFRQAFLDQLHSSRYWNEIEQLPNIPLPPNAPSEHEMPSCGIPG